MSQSRGRGQHTSTTRKNKTYYRFSKSFESGCKIRSFTEDDPSHSIELPACGRLGDGDVLETRDFTTVLKCSAVTLARDEGNQT